MTYHSATLPGQKFLGDWLTQKFFGNGQPPDPLLDRLTVLEDAQRTERLARVAEVATLTAQIAAERDERTKLTNSLTDARTALAVAEADLKSAQRAVTNQATLIDQQRGTIAGLNVTVENIQVTNGRLTSEITAMAGDLGALREQNKDLKERSKFQSDTIKNLQLQIESLETQVKELMHERAGLNDRLMVAEARAAFMAEENARLRAITPNELLAEVDRVMNERGMRQSPPAEVPNHEPPQEPQING